MTSFIKESLTTSIVGALGILGSKTQRKFWLLILMRISVGFLDLVGVLLLGLFTSASLKGSSQTSGVIPFASSWHVQPVFTLVLAIFALSAKSGMSYLINLRLVSLLNRKSSQIITARSIAIANSGTEIIDSLSSQKLHYMVTAGVRGGTTGILIPLATLIPEGSLVIIFCVFLLVTNPFAALLPLALLGGTSVLLHRYLSNRQYENGKMGGTAEIKSLSLFQETIFGYKELLVSGNLEPAMRRFGSVEEEISELQSKRLALSTLPRHVLESAVMLSLGLVAAVSLLMTDIESTILLLTVFGAATARILPSLIPLQSSLAEIQINIGRSLEYQKILLFDGNSADSYPKAESQYIAPLIGRLNFENVSYRYPTGEIDALQNVSFCFSESGWYAIDGPSGSGKSTVFDLLMGIRTPSEGRVAINGRKPKEFVQENPGYCSYLPQRITVLNSTIAENVAFGLSNAEIDIEHVCAVLTAVGLDQMMSRTRHGLFESIGEMGNSISGGQLQRLGIARCLYTNPSILLLDESTSGLDRTTQTEILDLVENLAQNILVVSISHDENVTKRAQKVIRLHNGQIVER